MLRLSRDSMPSAEAVSMAFTRQASWKAKRSRGFTRESTSKAPSPEVPRTRASCANTSRRWKSTIGWKAMTNPLSKPGKLASAVVPMVTGVDLAGKGTRRSGGLIST